MKYFLIIIMMFFFSQISSQSVAENKFLADKNFKECKVNTSTRIKNQGFSNTGWCFGATAMIEANIIQQQKFSADLSEMFLVRNIYIEKARNYILRQGAAPFMEGATCYDAVFAMAKYGAVPSTAYVGFNKNGIYDHTKMVKTLKQFLDEILLKKPIPADWLSGYILILDKYMGSIPTGFTYDNHFYDPVEFSKKILKFNFDDYIPVMSFNYLSYYARQNLQVPNNFSNLGYYNLPLDVMLTLVKKALENGYTVAWETDVNNYGFQDKNGYALHIDNTINLTLPIKPDIKELDYSSQLRDKSFRTLTTQDTHCLTLVGIEKSYGNKTFFIAKNSWGENIPFRGYVNVSEAYFAMNTIAVILPKAVFNANLLNQLQIPAY